MTVKEPIPFVTQPTASTASLSLFLSRRSQLLKLPLSD